MKSFDEQLRDATPPDASAAEQRAWSRTTEVFAEYRAEREAAEEGGRRGRARVGFALATPVVLAAVAAVLLAVVAFTPSGDAVADWVKRVVDPPPPRPVERPVALPAGGRVLVVGEEDVRIVDRDGVGRSLGRWDGATWSPNGRFVAAWRGTRLAAVAPDGSRRWEISARRPITAARWSPEGFHVAYLVGDEVRVVAGNGLRDRHWRSGAATVAPAFRPDARRTLAWVRRDGRVFVEDVFTGALRARSGPKLGRGARAVAWTADGRRLAVLSDKYVRTWNPRTGTVTTTAPLEGRGVALAGGPRIAAITRDERRNVSTVHVLGKGTAVRVRGTLGDLAFSPDGRTLLATWPSERRWLVLGAGGQALDRVPALRATRGHLAGWCCPT